MLHLMGDVMRSVMLGIPSSVCYVYTTLLHTQTVCVRVCVCVCVCVWFGRHFPVHQRCATWGGLSAHWSEHCRERPLRPGHT